MALPRSIASQVEYLLQHSPLPIQVDNFRSSLDAGYDVADRFSVLLPCFLDYVRWEVVFNYQNPCWPPDVIFGAEDAGFQPLVTAESKQLTCAILKDWNMKDPTRLLRLLVELRAQYLQYQRRRVEAINDPRLGFEIGTMSDVEGLEMGLISGADGPEVVFSVPLREVDLSPLTRACQIPAKVHHDIFLQVKYPVQRGQPSPPSVPQLRLHAPYILKEVFNVEEIKLPTWPEKMCLMEYVPKLQEMLTLEVRDACTSLTLRRNLMEVLVPVFGRPLEAETVFCRKISFVVSSGIFSFLVHASLPVHFHKSQPTLTLQSLQHFDSQGRPISRAYDDYPWSPRWELEKMAQRICDFIAEESPSFKKFCTETLQHHQY